MCMSLSSHKFSREHFWEEFHSVPDFIGAGCPFPPAPRTPVYMIAINEVSDQDGYAKEYVPPAQKSVKDHGGEYVAAGPGTQLAGNLPHGPVVILRWESMEALEGWRNSPDFQAVFKIGEKYAKFNIVAVNGVK